MSSSVVGGKLGMALISCWIRGQIAISQACVPAFATNMSEKLHRKEEADIAAMKVANLDLTVTFSLLRYS